MDWTGRQLNFRACGYSSGWKQGERPAYDRVMSPSRVLTSPSTRIAPNPWPSLYGPSRDFAFACTYNLVQLLAIAMRLPRTAALFGYLAAVMASFPCRHLGNPETHTSSLCTSTLMANPILSYHGMHGACGTASQRHI